jgi:hypothetical protein
VKSDVIHFDPLAGEVLRMPSTTHRKIIRGGYVLNRVKHQAEPADVWLEGDRIAALLAPEAAAPEGAEPIDAANRLLIPGLINAHTHSHGGLAKGMGDRWTLELLLHAARWLSGSCATEHLYLFSLISFALSLAIIGEEGTTLSDSSGVHWILDPVVHQACKILAQAWKGQGLCRI